MTICNDTGKTKLNVRHLNRKLKIALLSEIQLHTLYCVYTIQCLGLLWLFARVGLNKYVYLVSFSSNHYYYYYYYYYK